MFNQKNFAIHLLRSLVLGLLISHCSLGFAFDDPDYEAICKSQLGKKNSSSSSPPISCGVQSQSTLSEVKGVCDKVYDDAYLKDFYSEVDKEMRRQEATAVGIKNCFLKEQTNQLTKSVDPEFCRDSKKAWDDALGSSSPNCCAEILPDVRKSMARAAFHQRVHKALAKLNFPKFDEMKDGNKGMVSLENQVANARKENRLSADEATYLKKILEKLVKQLQGVARTKGEEEYKKIRDGIQSEIEAKTAFQNKTDELMGLNPPDYAVSAETGKAFFGKQAQKKSEVAVGFLKGTLESQIRICAMRKFADISVAVVQKGIQKTKDDQYCKAAERLAAKCKSYENDILTQLSTPLGEAGFVMVGAGMAISTLASPWIVMPGLIIGEVSSFATLRDELIYSELDQLHIFNGSYQGDKETGMTRFLNITSSVPNVVPMKMMSLTNRRLIWETQFVEGEVGARISNIDGNTSLPQEMTSTMGEIAKTADSFKSKNNFSESEQIIYDHIVADHLQSTGADKITKFQNEFDQCIEKQLVGQTMAKTPTFYGCEMQVQGSKTTAN